MDILTIDIFSPTFGIPLPQDWKNVPNQKLNKLRNMQTWMNVFIHLQELWLANFDLEGADDDKTVDKRVFFMSLLWYGRVCLFQKYGQIYGLPIVNSTTAWTKYGRWTSGQWVALNGDQGSVRLLIPGSDDGNDFLLEAPGGTPVPVRKSEDQGVIVRANAHTYPFITTVMQYADYISDTLRTLDTARVHLKHPYIIQGDPSTIDSIGAGAYDIKENQDFIIRGKYQGDRVEVENLIQGEITNEIRSLLDYYEARYLGQIGVKHNKGVDKKGENVTGAEISVDDESDDLNINTFLTIANDDLNFFNERFNRNYRIVVKTEKEKEDGMDGQTNQNNSGLSGQRAFSDGDGRGADSTDKA